MIEFTLYRANCKGKPPKLPLPKQIVVRIGIPLEAIKFDHVSAKYKDN